MTRSNDSTDLLSLLMDNLHSQEGKQIVSQYLQKEKIIEPGADFGDTSSTRSVEVPKAKVPVLQRALGGAQIELSSIYENRQKKVGKIFTLCLIAISLFVLLLAIGLIFAFVQEDSGTISKLTTAGSLVPGFLGATAFFIYKRENTGLNTIEKEIIKLKKLEAFFEMSKNTNDKLTLNKAYEKLVEQMKV